MTTNSPSGSSDEIQEWECPYCNRTRQNLSDLREHITESTEGDHQGVDGLKPIGDLIAYGPDGEVDRIEGVSIEPADSLEEYDKREIIINAWLAADQDPYQQAVQSFADASQQYVSRLLRELDSGEIPRETWIEVIDYGLRDELKKRLANYEQEDSPMSAQEATPNDIIEESSKKERIIALYQINPNVAKKPAAESLDVSYEYVRQIFKDIDDRAPDEWEKLREGDLEDDPDPQLVDAVEDRLRSDGVLAADTGADDTSGEKDDMATIVTSAGTQQSSVSASTTGTVPVEDLLAVRERVKILREQAEFNNDTNAEFVAAKTEEWIDELVDSAD